jgi:cysteine desulfurase/selenocysteine lyase
MQGTDVESPVTGWRARFPALGQNIGGKPLVYLDTAATSQRPIEVIDAIAAFYRHDNANPAPGLHALARRAHDRYTGARETVARFVGALDPLEIVFTRGTTEAINLVATAWGDATLRPSDDVLIGIGEHASNMMPWQSAVRRTGASVRFFSLRDDGHIDTADFESQLTSRTRIVAFSHVSNVLGLINPVKELTTLAHRVGAVVLVDAAQSVPHIAVDVRELGCDFLAFSSHKMCGPMGVGVLWARRSILDAMPPYQTGSNMAHDVGVEDANLSDAALKFGAGTPNVAGAVGLAAAADFVSSIGRAELWDHEQRVTTRMLTRLGEIRGVRLLGTSVARERVGVFSFTVAGKTPLDVASALDTDGIAVRAGDLASLPLLERFGERAAVRASCYLYTTLEEIDQFADALEHVASGERDQR